MVTAQQAAADWVAGLQQKQAKIQAGVEAVSSPPGQAAARNKAAYIAQVTASADKWASRVSAVSLQSWKDSMVNKGLPRIASGAASAQGKVEAFLTRFLPHVASGKAALPPRGGLEANIQRAVAMMRHNAAFKG